MRVKWQTYNGHKSDHKGIEVEIKGVYEDITTKHERYRLIDRRAMRRLSRRMLEMILEADSVKEVRGAM